MDVAPPPEAEPEPDDRPASGAPLVAWVGCVIGAAVSVAVVWMEPRLDAAPAPSLAWVALPYAVLGWIAWWGRHTATARWVALAGVLLVFALGAALWLAWAEAPLARLAAPRLIPGRQMVAVAVVVYTVSLARRSGM